MFPQLLGSHNVMAVIGSIEGVRDIEIVLDELGLKDLQTILNIKSKQDRQARTGIKEA